MKKLMVLVLSAFLLLGLIGCSVQDKNTTDSKFRTNTYSPDDTMMFYSVMEYNENGIKTKMSSYTSTDEIFLVSEYDEYGDTIKQIKYSPDGTSTVIE